MKFRDVIDREVAIEYRRHGWWGDVTLVDHVRRHAAERPDRPAYISDDGVLTWRELDAWSDRLAMTLCAEGYEPGSRIAVLLPDGATVHAVYLALEKAGLVTVGIGSRAGTREIDHLLAVTDASALIMGADHRGASVAELSGTLHWSGPLISVPVVETDASAPIVVDGRPVRNATAVDLDARRIRSDDLCMINSTSGTTGLPKCVLHTPNRWLYFHQVAARNGQFRPDDVFMSVVPAPFGFGLWTSHYSPIVLGAPTVVMRKFDAAAAMARIDQHRVTVLGCVSTQFVMMLNEATLAERDLSSLRVMFTGGEAVPAERAQRFEEQTGCCVLQFYGSNETGLLSGTKLTDPAWLRFETAGAVEPDMQVRLYDLDGAEQVDGEGRPACKGPATCVGYLDEAANAQLFTADGWMLMGDLCTIDADGILRVTGRTSDIIIRGGKNISAGAVEDEVCSHPAIALAAAVALPDDVFGERVLVFVELKQAGVGVTLDELRQHLLARGTSVELIPEALEVLPELPRSSGGKISKGELAELARRRG